MLKIATHFDAKPRPYTGRELRPHFLLTQMGLRGSGLGVFAGPCEVMTEHLVDWEDRLAEDSIRAKQMVHFVGEFFGFTLREGVYLQRLLMAILCESLTERLKSSGWKGPALFRSGDDLFVGERKLSVSIVTASPVSALLHTGINIDPEGAPVPAIGLMELGIEIEGWVSEVLGRYAAEHESMEWACAKVRPVV